MHHPRVALPALAVLGLLFTGAAAQQRPPEVKDPWGRVIEVLGPEGRSSDVTRLPAPPAEAPAAAGVGEGSPADCAGTAGDPLRVVRETRRSDRVVDACGRVAGGAAETAQAGAGPAPRRQPGTLLTIDRMTTRVSYSSHEAGGSIVLMGSAETYHLSDGSQWASGAGSYYHHDALLSRVEVSGSTIRYVLSPPTVGLIYQQTDYDAGDHSAQGSLGPSGGLVIEAQLGSASATLRGNAVVVSNDATWYGVPRFNYYTAILGAVVPFEVVFTLSGDTWTPTTFDRAFTYSSAGWVDFAHPVSTPRAVELAILGPARIPDEASTPFVARVRYESGVLRDVSAAAGWSVEPSGVASVAGGVVTVGPLTVPEELLTLRATYAEGPASLAAEKQVRCLADLAAEGSGLWPMFQADARHTGFLPIGLDPALFSLRWQRDVGGDFALNPVTAGDGKVFVSLETYFSDVSSLFALRALDGETLWSKGFGDVFSVNPPSYAYGNVYVQTGNHSTDTWLHAFDAGTGDLVFDSPHSAQWERYFAPTIADGKVYVNGGYYGGMYAFDAFSGSQLWFASLPQYDQWTPAVSGGRAYAYLGEYTPGLYGRDRLTGAPALFVADPNFDWNGWSMDLAPVIGGHDDVIAIHDGRLISFDTAQGTIRWELAGQFTGQPSVAHGRIYAVAGGRLVVLDELSHAELWSWQPPDGGIVGPMIVTETHLLASTATSVHAVDLLTRQSAWTHPVAGHLALADDTLYVASPDGTLTAFTAPRVVPSPLVSLELAGPAQVPEGTTAAFHALAHYADGSVVERSLLSQWSVDPGRFAAFVQPGQLAAGTLIEPFHDVQVEARYVEHGQAAQAALAVRLAVGVSLQQLVRRNLAATLDLKQRVVRDLASALELERASAAVLRELPPTPWSTRAGPLVLDAICREEDAREAVEWSVYDLVRVQVVPPQTGPKGPPSIFEPEPPAPHPRPERCEGPPLPR